MGAASGKTDKEQQALTDFDKFDLDGNKVISLAELSAVFQQLDPSWTPGKLKQLFNAVDANRNGGISVQEFVDWVMRDEGDEGDFMKATQSWRRETALDVYPTSVLNLVVRMIYEAGTWANVQMTEGRKAEQSKRRIDNLHADIMKKGVLSPGALTQLRDMALACSLLVVAELRLDGEGLEDAERWLKKSIEPKPHLVGAKLWRASYDLCFATARHACFLHLEDAAQQNQAKEHWMLAASVCSGVSYDLPSVNKLFLRFQTENK